MTSGPLDAPGRWCGAGTPSFPVEREDAWELLLECEVSRDRNKKPIGLSIRHPVTVTRAGVSVSPGNGSWELCLWPWAREIEDQMLHELEVVSFPFRLVPVLVWLLSALPV